MYVSTRGLTLSTLIGVSLLGVACNSGSPGDGTGGDVSGEADGPPGEDGADGPPAEDGADGTTGPLFEPDDNACELMTCITAQTCCLKAGIQASSYLPLDNAQCPGFYPNNWSCWEGFCVHGGCSNSWECGHPSLACKQVSGTGYCVQVCDPMDDAPCGPEGMHLACSGEADDETNFCKQDPPP